MTNLTHAQVQQILRSGKEISDYNRGALVEHLSGCSQCQLYADLVAELNREVPEIYLSSLFSKQEIHEIVLASQSHLWRKSMFNRFLHGTGKVIWLGVSIAFLLILFISPQLLPKQTNGLPTISTLTIVAHSPMPTQKSFPTLSMQLPSDAKQYKVAQGENLFSIAKKFGLKPETILWANNTTLQDNPNNIKPGLVLRIPPMDGLYYQWQSGDEIKNIANYFGVDTQTILSWSENTKQISTEEKVEIQPGTLIFIPNGKKPLQPVPTGSP